MKRLSKRLTLSLGFAALALSLCTLVQAQTAPAQPAPAASATGITGTMDITYDTRTLKDTSGDLKANSPAKGAKDKYVLNLAVNKSVLFTGQISRQPNLYSRIVARKEQAAQLYYKVGVAVVNPKNEKQTKSVGTWVGTVPIDQTSGAYQLGSGGDSPLRFAIEQVGKQTAFTDQFSGTLQGKAEKKESLASYTFYRVVGDKKVKVEVKRSDPMRFNNIRLARGPSDNYSTVTANGRLDYDYETGNYLTDGITFTYPDGHNEKVTGSIKWVEDPARKQNGKGHYEFNLRWDEDQHKPKQGEGAAFSAANEEDAFFAVDASVPSLTGNVEYVDTFIDANADEPQPSSSKVTYALVGNQLNKEQVMAFAKLWLVAIGPTNDE
jgi:hypothetical protein